MVLEWHKSVVIPLLKYSKINDYFNILNIVETKVFLLVKVSLSRSSHVFITHVVSVERADFRCAGTFAHEDT